MRILLIWPYGYDITYTMPLSLGYLKSNLGERHDIKLLDCSLLKLRSSDPRFLEELKKFSPDLVGVSCWSPVYNEGISILKLAKQLNGQVITVMGGAHCTSYYHKVVLDKNIDFVFRGESELSFPIFVQELEGDKNWDKVKGLCYVSPDEKIIANPMERENEVDKIKFPNYRDIQLENYIQNGYRFNTTHERNAPVWITRGCPYRCGFCSAPLQNGKKIRMHSIEYMTNWVKYLYYEQNIRMINIIDDNFTFFMDYAKEFCTEMIKLNLPDLKFGTPNGIRAQRTDEELLSLMKQAGWDNLIVAPESGSRKTLERMKKDLDPDLIPEKVAQIKRAGLKVHGFFIIGYPGEKLDDLKETVSLLRKCKFNFFFLNNFQPLPGTPIYDELVQSGEIEDGLLPEDYSNGKRVYFPKDLEGFNFAKFVLKEYLYMSLTNPKNLPYMFKLINPRMVAKKLFNNVKNMLTSTAAKERVMPQAMIMQE